MKTLLTLCAGILLFTPLSAQDRAFVCDSGSDSVYLFTDFDADFDISASEITLFYSDASSGPDLSTPNHVVAYGNGILLSDGGTLDAIFYLEDLNGDGDAEDAGEIVPFYDDSSDGPNLSTPNGLVVAADGSVYASDDGSGVRSIFCLVDLDGDGNALSTGEVTVFYDGDTSGALVTDPEALTLYQGDLLVSDVASQAIYRLSDSDQNGTVDPVTEVALFLDLTSYGFADVESILVDATDRVFVIDEDTGQVVTAVDLDGDGNAMGTAESQLFYDGSGLVTDANDATLNGTGGLLIADGALDAVVLLVDTDQNGTIEASEEQFYFDDSGALLSTPSGIAFLPASAPTPVVLTEVTPRAGNMEGGTPVTIEGDGLNQVTNVWFGGDALSYTLVSNNLIEVTTQAVDSPRSVQVQVEVAGVFTAFSEEFRFQRAFIRGDVNRDSVVNISDPVSILRYLFGTDPASCLAALDYDDNSQVGLDDALGLLSYLFSDGPSPLPPFPNADIDPTFDSVCEAPGS